MRDLAIAGVNLSCREWKNINLVMLTNATAVGRRQCRSVGSDTSRKSDDVAKFNDFAEATNLLLPISGSKTSHSAIELESNVENPVVSRVECGSQTGLDPVRRHPYIVHTGVAKLCDR